MTGGHDYGRYAAPCCGRPSVDGRRHRRCEVAAELAAYADDAEPVTDPDEAERLTNAAVDEMYAEEVYRELVAGREPEPNPDAPW